MAVRPIIVILSILAGIIIILAVIFVCYNKWKVRQVKLGLQGRLDDAEQQQREADNEGTSPRQENENTDGVSAGAGRALREQNMIQEFYGIAEDRGRREQNRIQEFYGGGPDRARGEQHMLQEFRGGGAEGGHGQRDGGNIADQQQDGLATARNPKPKKPLGNTTTIEALPPRWG